MASRKSKKARRLPKPERLKRVPGDHCLRFYRDEKSSHFFMGISESGRDVYGHNLTTHPSLTTDGKPRAGYQALKKNPNPKDVRKSYYEKSIKKIRNTKNEKGPRLKIKTKWKIGKNDLKRIRKADKKRIKNIHPAKN